MVPPTSMRTWAVVVPFFTSTIFPLRTLRALSFMTVSIWWRLHYIVLGITDARPRHHRKSSGSERRGHLLATTGRRGPTRRNPAKLRATFLVSSGVRDPLKCFTTG